MVLRRIVSSSRVHTIHDQARLWTVKEGEGEGERERERVRMERSSSNKRR